MTTKFGPYLTTLVPHLLEVVAESELSMMGEDEDDEGNTLFAMHLPQ